MPYNCLMYYVLYWNLRLVEEGLQPLALDILFLVKFAHAQLGPGVGRCNTVHQGLIKVETTCLRSPGWKNIYKGSNKLRQLLVGGDLLAWQQGKITENFCWHLALEKIYLLEGRRSSAKGRVTEHLHRLGEGLLHLVGHET
jgi:hypothetical protein